MVLGKSGTFAEPQFSHQTMEIVMRFKQNIDCENVPNSYDIMSMKDYYKSLHSHRILDKVNIQ